MKTIFVPVKYTGKIKLNKPDFKFPNKLNVLTTVQFLDRKKELILLLKKQFPKTEFEFQGQILGCNVSNAKGESFLYVGTGEFHPLKIKYDTSKETFTWNPISGETRKISEKELDKFENQKRLGIVRYMNAKNIGILVTTKPGQHNLDIALDIQKRIKNKMSYIFLWDNIDTEQFDNFNFVDCWINTACPRLQDDFKGALNANDFYEIESNLS